MKNGRTIFNIVFAAVLVIIFFAMRSARGNTQTAQTTTPEPAIEYVAYDPSLPAGSFAELTLASCDQVYQTYKVERSTMRVGNSRTTTEVDYIYNYAFCTDADGNEVVLLFEDSFSPDIALESLWSRMDKAEQKAESFRSQINAAGEDGLTVRGTTIQIDATDQMFFGDNAFGPAGELDTTAKVMSFLQDISGRVLVKPEV